jgi:formate-dependent nitrite reductase membrane component NrfD
MYFVRDQILKIFAIVVFLIIVYSMASALYYMYKDKGQSTRMVRSLSIRIGLSFFLFIVMLIAHRLEMTSG